MAHPIVNDALVVYVVDDEPSVRSLLSRLLGRTRYHVRCFATAMDAGAEILRAGIDREPVDVVLLDMALESGSPSTEQAQQLLTSITQRQPRPEVLLMSGQLSSDEFFRLIMQGATDFVAKPWITNDLLKRVSDCGNIGREKFLHHYSLKTSRSHTHRAPFSATLLRTASWPWD